MVDFRRLSAARLGKIGSSTAPPAHDGGERFNQKAGADSIRQIWRHPRDDLSFLADGRSDYHDPAPHLVSKGVDKTSQRILFQADNVPSLQPYALNVDGLVSVFYTFDSGSVDLLLRQILLEPFDFGLQLFDAGARAIRSRAKRAQHFLQRCASRLVQRIATIENGDSGAFRLVFAIFLILPGNTFD